MLQKILPYTLLLILRTLYLILIYLFTNYFLNYSDQNLLCLISIFLGTYIGTQAYHLKCRTSVLVLFLITFVLLFNFLYFIIESLYTSQDSFFQAYVIFQNLEFLIYILIFSIFSFHLSLVAKNYTILEFLSILLVSLAIFNAHRNFRFDLIKTVNSLAWNWNLSPLVILTLIATAILLFLLFYLHTFNNLYFLALKKQQKIHYNSKRIFISYGLSIIFIALFSYFLANKIHDYYFVKSDTVQKNGVGSESEEDQSPLDFHSALGSSSQPSAIVRLASDYPDNPHSPMLYLRESALSKLSGNELVIANAKYDQDITRTTPFEKYERDLDLNFQHRKSLEHSIYLLTNHKQAFGIDYPKRIVPLKIKEELSEKFKGAFKVKSFVPILKIEDLTSYGTDIASWNEEKKTHYTKQHDDIRYKELAEKITSGITDHLSQATEIANYLSKNAIYTLQPDHKVKDEGDKTAAFLFGDMRGYCVHFAHATVFMLRSLGIPSRIATGYLTDFSQAKDGHILLRLSDRHAWAEVYVSSIGWIPFDTVPEQVESHAETPVDQAKLDELIDLLGTDEEIISDELLEDEIPEEKESPLTIPLPSPVTIYYSILILLILIYLIKIYQRFSWLYTKEPNKKLKRIYMAAYSLLVDLGEGRRIGETKEKYFTQISKKYEISHNVFAQQVNEKIYSSKTAPVIDENYLQGLHSKVGKFKRFIAFLNPLAALQGIGLWKW